MVCFDLDNTLCDSSSAEAECEVFIIDKITHDLNSKYLHNSSDKTTKKNTSKTKHEKTHTILTTIHLLKIFNNIKNNHLHKDELPEGFSRKLWFDEMIQELADKNIISISSKDISLFKKNTIHYEESYWQKFNASVKLYSNSIYTLDYLKSLGLKLALVTDSDGRADVKLNRIKHLGIGKYFDYIITGDESKKNKPDIRNWQLLFEKSSIPLNECIMIGDHPEVDLVNAKKLGMITVWTKQNISLSLKHKYVDYEIHDVQEICNLINNFNVGKV
jgi:putative hydrolase of the HAD superfamily